MSKQWSRIYPRIQLLYEISLIFLSIQIMALVLFGHRWIPRRQIVQHLSAIFATFVNTLFTIFQKATQNWPWLVSFSFHNNALLVEFLCWKSLGVSWSSPSCHRLAHWSLPFQAVARSSPFRLLQNILLGCIRSTEISETTKDLIAILGIILCIYIYRRSTSRSNCSPCETSLG